MTNKLAIKWRWFLLVFVSGLFILVRAPHIRAHAELLAAQPAPGARLYRAPAQIRLTFTEPIGADSSLVVFRSNFRHVDGVEVTFDPNTPEQLAATLPALTPGVYTVQWTAVSADRDVIRGSYAFQVTGSLLDLVDRKTWLLVSSVSLFSVVLVFLAIRWRKLHPSFIVVLLILLPTLAGTRIRVRAHG
ncbi:MAG TPA: copper resistance CopC family protein [Anaerolineae bacterium]